MSSEAGRGPVSPSVSSTELEKALLEMQQKNVEMFIRLCWRLDGNYMLVLR